LPELLARRPQVNLSPWPIDALNRIHWHEHVFSQRQQPPARNDHDLRDDCAFFLKPEIRDAADRAIGCFDGIADELGTGLPRAAKKYLAGKIQGTALRLPPIP
jgi:hypothetical protein